MPESESNFYPKLEPRPYGIVETRENTEGYILYFRDKTEADRAVRDFWSKVWSKTPEMFERGMWKPNQQLTGGADFRTQPISIIEEEIKHAGATSAYFIGSNGGTFSEKGVDALKELGVLK